MVLITLEVTETHAYWIHQVEYISCLTEYLRHSSLTWFLLGIASHLSWFQCLRAIHIIKLTFNMSLQSSSKWHTYSYILYLLIKINYIVIHALQSPTNFDYNFDKLVWALLRYYPQVLLFEKDPSRKYFHNKSSKTINVVIGRWRTLYASSSPASFLRTISSIPLPVQLSCCMSF